MKKPPNDFLQKKLQLAFNKLEILERIEVNNQTIKSVDVYAKVYYFYQNVIERSLGLATYILKDADQPIPSTARESFVSLAEMGVITSETARQMAGAYGMRNAIIHDYDDFHTQLLLDSHNHNLENLRNFLQQIARYID